MSRRPHYLYRARQDTIPTRLVAVCCDGIYHDMPGVGVRQVEALKGWSACGWSTDTKGAQREWRCEGADAESFWTAALWHLKRGGTCWVVCWHAARVAGLLDLWGQIDQGKLAIYCPDGAAKAKGEGKDAKTVSGYVVLEDPPVVLSLVCPGLPGRICLVDARNYGIDVPAEQQTARARAVWIAGVMRRMCICLAGERWGSLCVTAGGQALYTLRRRYLTHAIHVNTNADALRLEGRAYFGGRCQAFRVRAIPGPVYHLDYRSLYGYLCMRRCVPTSLVAVAAGGQPADVGQGDWGCDKIAEVTLRSGEAAWPMRLRRRPVYPAGTYRTTLCGPELTDAIRLGRVLAVHRAATYTMAPALSACATAIYDVLNSPEVRADAPIAAWLKRVLVCLSGKFGQRGGSWQPWPDAPDHARWTAWTVRRGNGETVRCRDIAGQAQWERAEEWGESAVPAIAAWICSAGRMRLLESIRVAGWKEVYYCDTDSLLVSEMGYRALLRSGHVREGEVGFLRLLGCVRDCYIFGPKHYCLDGRITCAGMPRGAVVRGPIEGTYWYTTQLARAAKSGRTPAVERVLRGFACGPGAVAGTVDAEGWVHPVEVNDP